MGTRKETTRQVWLTVEELDHLSHAVAQVVSSGHHVFGADDLQRLQDIHDEMAISVQKHSDRSQHSLVARVLGRKVTDTPLELTVDDITILASLEFVSDELCIRLMESL